MSASRPIHFVHLTDIHISAPGRTPLFGLNAADRLTAVFQAIAALELTPAFIVISGDLTHDGDAEDYRFLRRLLDDGSRTLGIPIHLALGNHDRRAAFREGYLGETASEANYYYSFMHDGLRVVMLNTQQAGSHLGRIDEEQLAWLRAELAEPAQAGTIIIHHHPVVRTPTSLMDGHLLEDADTLLEELEGRGVIGLLSGHIHYHNVGVRRGMLCASADGVAFGLDPFAEGAMRFLDRSGFNLVTVKEQRMIVQPMTLQDEQRVLYTHRVDKAAATP